MNRLSHSRFLSQEQYRLREIDERLTNEAQKPYLYVNAVRGCVRFRICIMRVDIFNFVATAQVGDRVHRTSGHRPSLAVAHMFRQIRWTLASNRRAI